MTVAAPSGVVTFLFTDVEGSTRRWENDADGMRAALAAHDEVLRSAIGVHGGFMFKHTGDGACAAFASPTGAVDAAVAAQRALELPVRMGIATGEAELRGTDYFGAVLNRAAPRCLEGLRRLPTSLDVDTSNIAGNRVGFGEPYLVAATGCDAPWRAVGRGNWEFTDGTVGGDAPDFVATKLGEPQVAVGTGGDIDGLGVFRKRLAANGE